MHVCTEYSGNIEMREVKSISARHGERKEIRNNSQRTCFGAGSSKNKE